VGEDSPTVEETVPDKSAGLAFMGVEYRDFLTYCRNIIGAALGTLPDRQPLCAYTVWRTGRWMRLPGYADYPANRPRVRQRNAHSNIWHGESSRGNCGSASQHLRTSMPQKLTCGRFGSG